MVKIAGSDIPNLSKIVEDAFDSVYDIYHGNDIEFDEIDTEIDAGMSDDIGDYSPDMSDISSE